MEFVDWFIKYASRQIKTIRIEKRTFTGPLGAPRKYMLRGDRDVLQIYIPDNHCAEVMYHTNDTFEVTRYKCAPDGRLTELSKTTDIVVTDGKLLLGGSGTLYGIKIHKNGSRESVEFRYNLPPGFKTR